MSVCDSCIYMALVDEIPESIYCPHRELYARQVKMTGCNVHAPITYAHLQAAEADAFEAGRIAGRAEEDVELRQATAFLLERDRFGVGTCIEKQRSNADVWCITWGGMDVLTRDLQWEPIQYGTHASKAHRERTRCTYGEARRRWMDYLNQREDEGDAHQ